MPGTGRPMRELKEGCQMRMKRSGRSTSLRSLIKLRKNLLESEDKHATST